MSVCAYTRFCKLGFVFQISSVDLKVFARLFQKAAQSRARHRSAEQWSDLSTLCVVLSPPQRRNTSFARFFFAKPGKALAPPPERSEEIFICASSAKEKSGH